jgi:hypothetical protein
MVDLAFGRALALMAVFLLSGCAASRPAVIRPQASNEVRAAMAKALEAKDPVALTRNALLLASMGGGMSDRGFDSFSAMLDPATLAADPRLAPLASRAEMLRGIYRYNASNHGAPAPRLAAEVPAEYRIVEGIAYDQATDRLFIGTVVDGRLAYLERGTWHDVPIGLPRGGLFGMAIDAKRRLLWIATGMVEESAARDGSMAGLIAVDLDRLVVTERLRAPDESGVPGDVTLGPDGTIYVSDSKTGAILRHLPGAGESLIALVPPGHFKSPQGMVLSRDGRRLYVADYGSGLWIVGLRDGGVTQIGTSGPMMLDGIDGLVETPRGVLVAVQNGVVPRRVSKLFLSERGDQVGWVEPLYKVPRDAGDPSLGTLHQRELWFVGDGQWERYGPGGVLKDGKPPRPTPILAVEAERGGLATYY